MLPESKSEGRKHVSIIGGGPAGICAAKTLLEAGCFTVEVFEKADRIGGIWAVDETTEDGLLSPDTPTNLSRFTVGFSDLDWQDVNLRSGLDGGSYASDDTDEKGFVPMFPKAWQVNRYLEAYRKRYLPRDDHGMDCVRLSTEVIGIERTGTPNVPGEPQWRLTLTHKGESRQTTADLVLVASGFFPRPRELARDVKHLNGMDHIEDGKMLQQPKVIHSSQFRNLDALFGHDTVAAGKNILIVGGGNSSGETAGNVAFQLSSKQYSADGTDRQRFKDCKIVHVTPRPLYALPPYNPVDEKSTTFLPLDLKLYDLSKRPAGPISGNGGRLTREAKDMIHGVIQSMVGGDQSDLSAALVSTEGGNRTAPYVALSESYSEFVRQGLIDVVRGRVTKIPSNGEDGFEAVVTTEEGPLQIDNVAAVIYATGFTPSAALHFLPEDVRKFLQYDPESMRLPVILEHWQTMHPSIPDLAFLGFYEGPYWPVIENQARLAASRWNIDRADDGGDKRAWKLKAFEESAEMLDLRNAMQSKGIDVPQYWFGDYLGYMEEIAAELKLQRNDQAFEERTGPVSPARYLSERSNKPQADNMMGEIHRVWQACILNGRYVPRACFRAMQGLWHVNRNIDSKSGALPSGNLVGTAAFHPRAPSKDKSGKAFDLEYLYIESGTFTTTTGGTMQATRRYVYRYSEANDEMSVWFVKPDKDLEVDYLFHNLTFVPPEEANKAGACLARADHLCVDDMYWTEYRLPVKGIALYDFEIKHTVKGPSKAYVATTKYTRSKKTTH